VCAECLWYAESGERLCPVHGELWQLQGKAVSPPERYAAGIAFSQISAANLPQPQTPYQGNGNDVNALIALIMGVASVLACYGMWYVLPVVAFLLGLVAWFHARDSLNPKRTQWLAGGAMASGGVLLIVAFMFGVAILMCAVFSSGLPNRSGPPPTPYLFPTPTP
jgi:hypothetical protein